MRCVPSCISSTSGRSRSSSAATSSTAAPSSRNKFQLITRIAANIDCRRGSVHTPLDTKSGQQIMKVVITGGAGFLGKKLARRILQQGSLANAEGKQQKVGELLLFDVAKATGPGLDDPRVKALAGDIANTATVQSIVQGASTVFHFAA